MLSNIWNHPELDKLGKMKIFSGLAASSLALSYVMLATRDILSNKTPRDLNNFDTFKDMLVYSGIGGLYSDIIATQFSTSKNTMLDGYKRTDAVAKWLLGPAGYKALVGIPDSVYSAFDGEFGKVGRDISRNAIATNLPYTKALYNYVLFSAFMDSKDISKSRRRMQDMGQDFIVEPS